MSSGAVMPQIFDTCQKNHGIPFELMALAAFQTTSRYDTISNTAVLFRVSLELHLFYNLYCTNSL